ncbi:hypothetical protein DXG01_016563 [Tephrocybe rancida]|nr:hypothetical protein DXG01_016563 [Tephrocybe rancida]
MLTMILFQLLVGLRLSKPPQPQDLNLVAMRPVVPQLALNPDGQLQDLNHVAARLVIPQLALNPDAATKGSQYPVTVLNVAI